MPHFSLIELHMASAHFPIGLLLASVFFDFLVLIWHKEEWKFTAYWIHLLGVVSAGVSVVLGLVGNPFRGTDPDLEAQAGVHQWFGIAALVLFGLLALWRVRIRRAEVATSTSPSKFVMAGFIATSLIASAIIGITGYLGSKLVSG